MATNDSIYRSFQQSLEDEQRPVERVIRINEEVRHRPHDAIVVDVLPVAVVEHVLHRPQFPGGANGFDLTAAAQSREQSGFPQVRPT